MTAAMRVLIGLSLMHLIMQAPALLLDITPRHALMPLRAPNATVEVICRATQPGGAVAPLAACQILQAGQVLDFSQGTASPPHDDAAYLGAGLAKGECGVTLKGGKWSWGNHMVGCRVMEGSGGWHYAAMVLDVSNFLPMRYDLLGPREVIAMPGTDVTILGNADKALDRCRVQITEALWLDFNQGHNSPTTTDLRYHGNGLLNMECGITLLKVTPDRSGFIRASVKHPAPTPGGQAFRGIDYVTLIVATPPKPPSLTLSSSTLNVGETLTATCIVANSRPVSNITWYIGDIVVRQDNVDDAPPENKWQWPHEPRSITQYLSRKVTLADDGKELKCQAGHFALPGGRVDSEKHVIRVRSRTTCSPSPCGPNSSCRISGNAVRCNCLPQYVGEPPNCRAECEESTQCPPSKACINQKCTDACNPSPCGFEAACHVQDHYPVCTCPAGSAGDPYVRCESACPAGTTKASDVTLPPKLTLTQTTTNRGGDQLLASCIVRQCFVVANVTWLLGNEVLQFYLINDTPEDVEVNPNAPPIVKQLRRRLSWRENGRELKCQVTYFGVDAPQTSKAFIHVPCPRLELSKGTDQILPPELFLNVTRYTEGEVLEATCIVRQCYVIDTISWYLGDKMLEYYYVDETEGDLADPAETRPIAQQLSRRLGWKDNMKELKCRVSFVGVKQPQMNKELVFVHFKDAPDVAGHPNVRLINSQQCGHVPIDVAISFGKNTELFQNPWMALLILNAYGSNPDYICGATVINNRYLLTAAHCVTPASRIPKDKLFPLIRGFDGTSSAKVIMPVPDSATAVAQARRASNDVKPKEKYGYFENYFKYRYKL